MSAAANLVSSLAAWRGESDAGARRRAAGLLVARSLLYEALTDRHLSSAEAVELARDAATIDPLLDLRLAQRLMERGTDEKTTARLLDVLESLVEGPRLGPLLGPLLSHASARVRSKAALVIGKANQSGQWAGRQLADADARVRANAIEALWSVDSESSRATLAEALRDPAPRVAGNAAIGLYRVGDTRSITAIIDMAASGAPEVRATAAWCMGHTRDRRFLSALASLLRDPEARVRQNALRSASRIRQQRIDLGALRVVIFRAWSAGAGARRLAVAVVSGSEWNPVKVAPTGFIVEHKGAIVTGYQVREVLQPDALAVGFALPRRLEPDDPWRRVTEDTLLRCARLRRRTDTWAVLKYAADGPTTAPPDLARFTAEVAALAAAITEAGQNHGSAPAVLGRLLSTLILTRGGRHLVLVGDPQPLGHERGRLVMQARAAHVAIHGIAAPVGSAELERLCRATGGAYLTAHAPEEIPELLERLCIGMLHRYEISYEGSEQEGAVRVEARSGGQAGFAEIGPDS